MTSPVLRWSAFLFALFLSLLLHTLGDLPLHHDDGHRHFFPFLDWRFESPVSYWDPAHYGLWFSLVEATAVAVAATLLYRYHASFRPWVLATTAIYVGYWCYVAVVWL